MNGYFMLSCYGSVFLFTTVPQISRLAVTQQTSPSRLGAKDTQMSKSDSQMLI